jgi:hypothetical protein
MIFAWLKKTLDEQARTANHKELTKFIDGLRTMTDEDMGVVLAVSTVLRVNMEDQGFLPEGLYDKGELPTAQEMARYQVELNKLVRQFYRKRMHTDGLGVLVISYSLRCLNVADLRDYGRDMWATLVRGFPHTEETLRIGQESKGEDFPEEVWTEWKKIPAGLEPSPIEGEGT